MKWVYKNDKDNKWYTLATGSASFTSLEDALVELLRRTDLDTFIEIVAGEGLNPAQVERAAFIVHGAVGASKVVSRYQIVGRKMSRKEINDLPDSDFAYIEPGGRKDEEGKTVPRSLRHFPIHDIAHTRNSLARLPQSKLPLEAKRKALRKIRQRAKKFGINVTLEL